VSSKADDFDVRFRDGRDGRAWGDGADEDHRATGGSGTVDYDLGYDANGWDTQGFRSPTAGYLDNHETAQLGDGDGGVGMATRPRHGGSHARPAGAPKDGFLQAGSPAWAPEVPGSTGPWLPDETGQTVQINHPGRRGRWARPGGPQGPDGPDGPGGPNGPRGPRGPRAPRVKVKGSWWRHWTWRKALGLVLSIIGLLVVLGAVAVVMIYENTSVPSSAMAATGYAQTTVESSNGTPIGRFGTTNRVQLNYNQIPPSLIWAVLAIEDRNFFNEGGISPTGIIRAAYEDMRGGNLQGGSTITQEFVRQYYTGIGTQQTLSRKFKEIFVAMKVAKEKSKQWILQNFLNTIYFGDGAYGVQAAAETYFNKPVWDLSVAQDAIIAAVIQQPSTYLLPQYRSDLVARWHEVLNGMVATGHLTAQQAAAMKFPVIGDNVPQSVGKDVWDPYILEMVYTELVDVYHFSQSQIYNGGYVIKTTIDDAKMKALYQAVQQNEMQMAADGGSLQSYMHVGAVLENPANGAIEALYPGPGYPGSRYVDADGVTHTMTAKECKILDCEVNMAVYNREQVGSSFKPYILATAVKENMNVQTSTLDGFDNLCIPPDSLPLAYPTTGTVVDPTTGKIDCPQTSYFGVPNDNTGENGPFTPQNAMAQSINTAYTDLWHKVGGAPVLDMAKSMGVNLDASGLNGMVDEAGVALGQASLTVAEQATMLAAIDDNGVYHDAHVVASITQNGVPTPIKITSTLVFSPNPMLNTEEATQVQYAMSKTTVNGTATAAAMTDGREIVGKTGTTNTAQSAFFIGAIPQQALAVGMFTNNQSGTGKETLNGLGGQSQGGFGGTWPATIWHTYAQNEFLPLPVVQFTTPVFTGQTWNLVPPNLRNVGKKHPKKKNNNNNQNPNPGNGGFPSPPPGNGNPNPYPTYSCDPSVVTCNPNAPSGGNTQSVSAVEAGAAMGGIVAGLPATCLWVRRRTRRGVTKRG
jgi:membrane peptidoglycan carboxypeptidase